MSTDWRNKLAEHESIYSDLFAEISDSNIAFNGNSLPEFPYTANILVDIENLTASKFRPHKKKDIIFKM